MVRCVAHDRSTPRWPLSDFPHALEQFYPDYQLPPLWATIYHEGCLGNHLVFDQTIVDTCETTTSLSSNEWDTIENIIALLLKTATLEDIRLFIAQQDLASQTAIFLVYKAWFRNWTDIYRRNLN